ncbi:hypothetical protein PGB90_009000 [Kerria lacca]
MFISDHLYLIYVNLIEHFPCFSIAFALCFINNYFEIMQSFHDTRVSKSQDAILQKINKRNLQNLLFFHFDKIKGTFFAKCAQSAALPSQYISNTVLHWRQPFDGVIQGLH